jgi:serine/threonine protein kinase
MLKHYQDKTPYLRPLLDEIIEPPDPPSIVLKHLDSDLLTESNRKRLSRPEIKQVARCVLQALQVLHKDGMVHTGKRILPSATSKDELTRDELHMVNMWM